MKEYQSIRPKVLAILERELPVLQKRYGIETIGIFGSVSRSEDNENSDIDIIYTFCEGEATITHLLDLEEYLEQLFNRKIDLVSLKWMSPVLKPYVDRDIVICGSGTA